MNAPNIPPAETTCICHININGIADKIMELELTLKELNAEIVCVTEHHWTDPTSIITNVMDGFTLATVYCRDTKKCGGAAIFISNNVQFTKLDISEFTIETMFEAVSILFEDFVILCIYRAPNDAMVPQFFLQLELCLAKISTKRKHVVICGDINIDTLCMNPRKLYMRKQLESFMAEQGLHTITDKATRISGTSGTAIDHIITNIQSLNYESQCNVEVGLSDHSLQYINIKTEPKTTKPNPTFTFKRIYPAVKVSKFMKELESNDWTKVYASQTVDDKFDKFYSVFVHLYEKHFPLRKYKDRIIKAKDWVTNCVRITSKNYRQLCMYVKINRDVNTRDYFTNYRRIYRKVIKCAKTLAIMEEVSNSSNVPKTVWSIINKNMGKTKAKSENINVKLSDDGQPCSDPTTVANAFNSFYSNVAKDLQNGNHSTGTEVRPHFQTMYLAPVTQNEVIMAISHLKNKRCSGYDGITDEIVKKCHSQILEPLTHIIEASFKAGVFPRKLKISKVLPLFKNGERNIVSNYRPVANIPTFAKIFENIMDKRVREYLCKFNILSKSQFGFIEKLSTVHAIVNFIHKIYNCLNTRKYVTGIFFDMSKAFDLVDHKILLSKLENYGIRGPALLWFTSYLSTRQHLVEITHTDHYVQKPYTSELMEVVCGVPQGSLLGPLLFLVYINDLSDHISTGHIVNFADDVNIAITGSSSHEVDNRVQMARNDMGIWCTANKLTLNDAKTNLVQFRTNENVKIAIDLPNHDLYKADAKFLGIYIDQFLRWNVHCEYILKKCRSAVYGIRRIRNITNQATARLAYFGMFHSRVSYGTLLWGNCAMASDLFRLQKKAIRAICKVSQRTSCRELFPSLQIMTVPATFIFQILLYVKSNSQKFLLNQDMHSHNTRHKGDIYASTKSLALAQNDIMYKGAILYNVLPITVRALSLKNFKIEIKKMLVNTAYYSVEEFCRCKV